MNAPQVFYSLVDSLDGQKPVVCISSFCPIEGQKYGVSSHADIGHHFTGEVVEILPHQKAAESLAEHLHSGPSGAETSFWNLRVLEVEVIASRILYECGIGKEMSVFSEDTSFFPLLRGLVITARTEEGEFNLFNLRPVSPGSVIDIMTVIRNLELAYYRFEVGRGTIVPKDVIVLIGREQLDEIRKNLTYAYNILIRNPY